MTPSEPNKPAKDSPTWASRLSVVIPAYNEEDGIVVTLEKLRASIPEAELIVVDDGSSDSTVERAKSVLDIQVIRHEFNQGYGAAIKSGMRQAKGEFVAWFDADSEHRVEDLAAMATKLEQEHLVAVIGQRKGAHQSVLRGTGKAAIKWLAYSLGAKFGKDINCGLRVFRRRVIMRYLTLLPDRFSASMTSTMIMIERGYPIDFHDVSVNPRIGTSKVKLADGFEALALVLRLILFFAPLRMFLGMGAAFILVGGVYSLMVALLASRGIPIAGMLSVTLGLLLCMLGLIADQISQLRYNQLPVIEPQRDSDSPDKGQTT